MTRWLVAGFGVTGKALARHLGGDVTVFDDRPKPDAAAEADALGATFVASPTPADLDALVRAADVLVPTPGLPPSHPVFAAAAAAGLRVDGEIEVAWQRAQAPVVAVTGTNGKTTVTTVIAAMLEEAGVRAQACGNIGRTFIEAVSAPDATEVGAFVVEVSSFQLEHVHDFRPTVGVHLNLTPDHLDHHPSMEDYAAAKARLFANQTDADHAVANADDPATIVAARSGNGRLRTFGVEAAADYRWDRAGGVLRGPDGRPIVAVDDLPRRLDHDLRNACAALAAAMAAGAPPSACATALTAFAGLPHRVTLVRDAGGVAYYDDSKATTPDSTLAALRGFSSVVLIAGGRNKGLDLSPLGTAVPPVHHVVAIGEAAADVAAAFGGRCPVVEASSMKDAVTKASEVARRGDAVLLSPACTSWDWYPSYIARGEDFARAVGELTA